MANYYVKPASISGSDSNDGSTFALAKATLNAAYALASAGDTIYVCSDTDDPFVDIELLLNSGASNVNFVGADTTDGTPYAGTNRAVISHTVVGSGYLIASGDNDIHSCKFYNISLRGVSSVNGYFSNSAGVGHIFINCEFKNLQYGCYISNASTKTGAISCFDCVFDTCTRGIYISSSGIMGIHCYCTNCKFNGNSYGIYTYNTYENTAYLDCATVVIEDCRFISNYTGFYAEGNLNLCANKNVFYSNSSHGISLDATIQKLNIRNTIFHSNGGYAIAAATATLIGNVCGYVDYNCYYNNTSGIVNTHVNGGTTPGSNNVTSNPLFASTTLGSEDFRLQESSPCLGTGIGYVSGQ